MFGAILEHANIVYKLTQNPPQGHDGKVYWKQEFVIKKRVIFGVTMLGNLNTQLD